MTEEKPYRCPVCGRGYKTALGLKRHLEAKHPDSEYKVYMLEPEPVPLPDEGQGVEVRRPPEEVSPTGDPGQGKGVSTIEPSPALDVDPVQAGPPDPVAAGQPDPVAATMQLALQNTQILNVLMGDKANPGMIASIQSELRQLREKLTTTREPTDSPLAELNRPENKWLQEILQNVSKGVQTWALGADSRDEAFLRYLGEDAKVKILENVALEKKAFMAFIEAAKKGDIKFGSDDKQV